MARALILILALGALMGACRQIPPFVELEEDAGLPDADEPDLTDNDVPDNDVPDNDVPDDGCGQTPRCEGALLVTCEQGRELQNPCAQGQSCVEGRCETISCTPNTATCEGDVVLSCPPEGGEPVRVVCNDQPPCQQASFGCVCREGQCQARTCEPSSVTCLGEAVQRCSDDGLTLHPAEPCLQNQRCLDGTCLDVVCQPNRGRCEGNALHLCNDEGTGEQVINCSGNRFCNSNPSPHCEERACVPNATRCTEDLRAVLSCDAMGSGETSTPCGAEFFCQDGACLSMLCPPGQRFCLDGGVHQCNDDGSDSSLLEACDDVLQACLEDTCRDIVCQPDAATCEEESLVLCNNNGTEATRQDCTRLESYCDPLARACQPWVCQPGSPPQCQDDVVMGCDERGTALTVLETCDNRGCVNGQCVQLPEGEACVDDNDCLSGNCSQGVCQPEDIALVLAGDFTMGSPQGEAGRSTSEGPQHEVRLSGDLLVMRSEVTQRDWADLMRNNPSVHRGNGLRPVENVSWFDALAYANALSRLERLPLCYDLAACTGTPGTGSYQCPEDLTFSLECQGWRLPTEAEWEYFARAGTTTAFPTGAISVTDCSDEPNLDALGWYCGNAGDSSQPVQGKSPNPWGLYDTAGNVFEWVWDRFSPTYYRDSPDLDPLGPDTGSGRVVRGGSWRFQARGARSAFRLFSSPDTRQDHFGFRLVRRAPR